MEAVGLAISIFSLAGIFKDCIDLFSMISTANSMGKDFTILSVKLDIERTLLLQWAEQVRLIHDDYDRRLDNPDTKRTITRILQSIKVLLSDGTSLEHRYGMEHLKIDERECPPILSSYRLQQFRRDFQELVLNDQKSLKTAGKLLQSQESSRPAATSNGHPKPGKPKATLKEKFCWTVRDKDKFGSLVRDLSELVRGLNMIVPRPKWAEWQSASLKLLVQDAQHVEQISRLELLMEGAKDHGGPIPLGDVFKKQIDRRCQQRILDSLWYRMLEHRRNSVSEAHPGTFNWALNPPTDDVEWDNLPQWFQSGSGIYWVHGKAGSGKTTLMKYLYDNPSTRSLLSEWAKDEPLLMPHFFFWHLGTPEQKTQYGLYRGLLYHIFEAKPSLIPDTLPEMWREAHNDDSIADETSTGARTYKLECPTEEEMMLALLRLKTHSQAVAFCFFIDGLDEYSGDTFRLIDFLEKLISSRIKVVVSSRPIPSCFQAFSRGAQLRLQDLTLNDIKTYVHDTIVLHPHTETLIEMDSTIVDKIQGELTEKACGVFLWVVLACRSLVQGFAAYDTPEELQERLKELPPELNDLFRHILQRFDPRYREQAAKLLSLCYYSTDVNTESGYPHKPLFTLGLALADADKLDVTRPLQYNQISQGEMTRKCKLLEARLRSRCCGLLEIRLGDFGQCFCQSHGFMNHFPGRPTCQIVDSTVEFIHRTMYEFLKTSGIWKHEYLQIHDRMFDPAAILWKVNAHLMLASIHRIRDHPDDHYDSMAFNDFLASMKYLQEMDSKPQDLYTTLRVQVLLSAMLETAKILNLIVSTTDGERPWLRKVSGYFKKHSNTSKNGFSDLVAKLLCELGMETALQHVDISSYGDPSSPLLYHVIEKPLLKILFARGNYWPQCPSIIRTLVARGCGVNEAFAGYPCSETTPWLHWLEKPPSNRYKTALIDTWLAQEFLKAGANVAGAVDRFQTPISTLIGRRILGTSQEGGNIEDEDGGFNRSHPFFKCDLGNEMALRFAYEGVRRMLRDGVRQCHEGSEVGSVPWPSPGNGWDEGSRLKRRCGESIQDDENAYSSTLGIPQTKRQRTCAHLDTEVGIGA